MDRPVAPRYVLRPLPGGFYRSPTRIDMTLQQLLDGDWADHFLRSQVLIVRVDELVDPGVTQT